MREIGSWAFLYTCTEKINKSEGGMSFKIDDCSKSGPIV